MAQSSRYTYSSDSGGSPRGSPNRSTSSHSGSGRTYMCKVCGHLFSSGQSLGGHMNVHRKDTRGDSHSPGMDNYNPSNSSSPQYKGVRYRKEQNKWVAEIRPPRASKTWWLGTYSTPEEAAYAYDVAITYFGSESSLNFDGHPTYEQIPRIAEDLPNQDFAAELRKVVKKYGKLAMKSGATLSASTDCDNGASASTETNANQSELLLPWEDFPPSLDDEYSGLVDFDVPAMFPQPQEPSFQLPWCDQESSYNLGPYYGYGYTQHSNWPPHSGPMDY